MCGTAASCDMSTTAPTCDAANNQCICGTVGVATTGCTVVGETCTAGSCMCGAADHAIWSTRLPHVTPPTTSVYVERQGLKLLVVQQPRRPVLGVFVCVELLHLVTEIWRHQIVMRLTINVYPSFLQYKMEQTVTLPNKRVILDFQGIPFIFFIVFIFSFSRTI